MTNTDQVATMLARINEERDTGYSLIGKMERGTNGAWLVETPDRVQHIFKRVTENDVTAQIRHSARSSAAVRGPALPTPRYEHVDFMPGFGSWYVQEFLDGIPSPNPSPRLVQQMILLNSRQSHRATAGGVEWNDRVMSALFADSMGWKENIASRNGDGRTLVNRVNRLIAESAEMELFGDDIVHGDFQHFNALVDANDWLTGYVDWEGAGKGDRAIDLARLLYDVYIAEVEANYPVNYDSVRSLQSTVVAISGEAALQLYMAYWVLQVANFIIGRQPQEAAPFIKMSHRILDDLQPVGLRMAA